MCESVVIIKSYLYFIEGVIEGGLDGVSSVSLNDSTDCVWMIKGVFKESLVSIIIDAIESFFRRLLTKIQSLAKTCLKRRQKKWRVGYHSRKVARILPMMAPLSTVGGRH